MSDVSAVVLSLGEPSTRRALESLASQTQPVCEVILVEHVAPFHRAFNEGAGRVTTPFFVQVDSDMALDATCIEELRRAMRGDVGLAYGELRDPLMGQVVGVKLFRTACVRRHTFADTIAPDTDFGLTIRRAGWRVVRLGLPAAGSNDPARTFGEHRPDYTPAYTFAKYLLEGRRHRYRGSRDGLFWQVERLQASPHSLARFAQIALWHGFFLDTERDELKPRDDDPRAEWLAGLLFAERQSNGAEFALRILHEGARLRDVFPQFLRTGQVLAEAEAGHTVCDVLDALAGVRRDWRRLVAGLSLGHGLLAGPLPSRGTAAAERVLRDFVRLGVGRRLSVWKQLQARAAAAACRLRPSAERVPW